MRPTVAWWEIETDQPEQFVDFHGELWGWQFRPAFEATELGVQYWVIHLGDEDIGGLQCAHSPVPSTGTRIYLSVGDLESTLRRVEDKGGEIVRTRVRLGASQWFALFRDPTGVLMGLWTAAPEGS